MKILWIASCIGIAAALLSPAARANTYNEKTLFTFSAPVEMPGRVLGPGTYVFTLLDSVSDRDIVQVWNQDQTKLLGTFPAIPDERLKASGKPVIMFEERPSTSPEAIKAWFYPGDLTGEEFVYPKKRARELAKRTGHAVPSMPDEQESNIAKPAKTGSESSVMAMKRARLKLEEPTGNEDETSQAITHATHRQPQTNIQAKGGS